MDREDNDDDKDDDEDFVLNSYKFKKRSNIY